MTIPTDPYEELKAAADELIESLGYYMLRVDQVLGRNLGPSTSALDDAVARVAKIIYKDDEAA
jgi:hypothetical protein